MKHSFYFIIVLLLLSCISFSQPDSWQQKTPLGNALSPRSGVVAFSIGSKGYVGIKDFWEYDPVTNIWTQKADMAGASRIAAFGFAIDGKGYIGGGNGGASYNDFKNDLWEYDPVANTWQQKSGFSAIARSGAVGFSINGKGYMGLGFRDTYKNDLWEYDPVTDAWLQKADFPGGGRLAAVGFAIGNKGYFGTGYNSSSVFSDFWEYDPAANAWLQKANFSGTPRYSAVGFSINNKGYIGTGWSAIQGANYRRDFWEYDPASDRWTQKADCSGSPRYGAFGLSIDGKGYVGSGYIAAGELDTVFLEYNPLTDAWTEKARITGWPTFHAVSFNIGNKGYIGNGYGFSGVVTAWWEYDPIANSWKQKAWCGGGFRTGGNGFQIGGKGYIGLGVGSSSWVNKIDFWEYDPVTDTWTQKANFAGESRREAVSFSIGNKGYIGTGLGNGYKKDLWEYDPANNTWTRKADFGGSERSSAIAMSIGGKGYIGTGYGIENNMGVYKKDFWEYDPFTDSWTQRADFGGTARDGAAALSIGMKGYVGLGYDGNFKKDFWEYDPAMDAWLQKTDFGGAPRESAAAFSIGNKGYIAGGYGTNSSYGYDLWEFTPTAVVVPVYFIKVAAYKQNDHIGVEWTVAEDEQVHAYKIEKSLNGKEFYIAGTQLATSHTGTTTYTWTDLQPSSGINYYRVQAAGMHGVLKSSQILRVDEGNGRSCITVYPNPVTHDVYWLNLFQKKKGKYTIKLFTITGQLIAVNTITHPGGSSVQTISLPSGLQQGVYLSYIFDAYGNREIVRLLIAK